MFLGAAAFNQNIGSWNVSNVTNMYCMFQYATAFNQNISSWNVSNVTNMAYMFQNATAFNQNISAWNVSKVTNMTYMFGSGAPIANTPSNYTSIQTKATGLGQLLVDPRITFTINLPAAATINIGRGFTGVTWGDGSTTVAQTHAYASAGSYTITIFNIGNQFPSHPSFTPYITNVALFEGITNMTEMFLSNATFNQDISGWDVSAVTNMQNMFQNAPAFNQNIGSWNVSNVTNMNGMFVQSSAFNGNISAWNVSNVTNMRIMFNSATAFNQNLSAWNVSKVTDMYQMFTNSPIRNTPSNYTTITARALALGQSLV